MTDTSAQDRAMWFPEALPAGLRVGVHLYNAGEYFECHEVLETIWRDEPRVVRELYQGILQVGVGFYHLSRGNHRGSVNLLGYGLARLERCPARACGLDVASFVLAVRRARERLVELGPARLEEFDQSHIPQLQWLST